MKFLILNLLILPSSNAFSKDYYQKNIVDRAHERFSKQILRLSSSIDNFFADSKHEDLQNRSKLKISLDTYFVESRGPHAIPDVNYRLMLPRTERRLQLFIEKEDDDNKDETSESKAAGKNAQDEDNDLTAGLRYMVEKSGIRFSWDNGVIVNVPMVVFSRFTAKKKILFDQWVLKVNQQVKWVNDNGFTSDLDLDFDKKLSRKFILRMVNNTFWNDQDYVVRFENGPSLFHQINRKMALSYHAHVVTINKPEFVVDNYILQITYRQLIYSKWLYMNISPFTNFPRINNFHRVPGLTVGFQAIIGHI
jgi:hypothetical protein